MEESPARQVALRAAEAVGDSPGRWTYQPDPGVDFYTARLATLMLRNAGYRITILPTVGRDPRFT